VPETVEYGISSFVFRARRPFHPTRLHSLVYGSDGCADGPIWFPHPLFFHWSLTRDVCRLRTVVRSKGFFWLATRMDINGQWAQAGRLFSFTAGGRWWADGALMRWPNGAMSFSGSTLTHAHPLPPRLSACISLCVNGQWTAGRGRTSRGSPR
jgi:G3E family GTPase